MTFFYYNNILFFKTFDDLLKHQQIKKINNQDKQITNLDQVNLLKKYTVKDDRFEKFLIKLNERHKNPQIKKSNSKKKVINYFNSFKFGKPKRKRKKIKLKNFFYTVKRRAIFKFKYYKGFIGFFKRFPRKVKHFMIIRKKAHFSSILRKKQTRSLSIPKSYKKKRLSFFKKRKNYFLIKTLLRQVTLMRKYRNKGIIYLLKHWLIFKTVLFKFFFKKNIKKLRKFRKRKFIYHFYIRHTEKYRRSLLRLRKIKATNFRRLVFFRKVLFRYNKFLIFRNKIFFKKKFIPVTKKIFKNSVKFSYLSKKFIIFKKSRKNFLNFFKLSKKRNSLKILNLKLKYFKFCFKFYYKLKSDSMILFSYKNFRKIKQIKTFFYSFRKKLNLFFLSLELGILSVIYRLFFLKSLSTSFKLIKDLAVRVNNFIIYSKFYKTKINDIIILNSKSLLFYFKELKIILFPLIKWQITPYSVTSYIIIAGIYFQNPFFLYLAYPNFFGLKKKIFSFFVWFFKYNYHK